jgi:hypothetical protein
MLTKSIAIALLLGEIQASSTADETYATTIAGCYSFAAKFANTCDVGSSGNYDTACSTTAKCTGST